MIHTTIGLHIFLVTSMYVSISYIILDGHKKELTFWISYDIPNDIHSKCIQTVDSNTLS